MQNFRKGGYMLSSERVTKVSLTQKQLQGWTKDERLVMRTLDWFESLNADLERTKTHDHAVRIFDRMIDLSFAFSPTEREKAHAALQSRKSKGFVPVCDKCGVAESLEDCGPIMGHRCKKHLPESAKPKAPKPQRIKGKAEEVVASKSVRKESKKR